LTKDHDKKFNRYKRKKEVLISGDKTEVVKESENESDSFQDQKEGNVFKTMDNRGTTIGKTFNADLEKL
jgi:hypothetical protein